MNLQNVEFFGIIESSYPNVPYAGERESNNLYVDLPNELYDPIQGQRNLETQFEILASLEKYGLDGAMFTEQHNGPIGSVPGSLTGAAYLAAKTEKIKIVVGGPLLNAYQSPIRLAEEIAVVDTLSRGRLTIGLPMGLGQQYHSLGMNPATARARHAESVDLLTAALTETGPFQWRGEFFNHNYVNIWPRPAHNVEFILPSGGSLETLEVAAKRRFTYQTVLSERSQQIKTLNKFRDLCRAEGYEPDPRQTAMVIEIHVAETDEVARRESEAAYLWNYQNYFEAPVTDSFPPGYTSPRSMRGILGQGYGVDTKKMTYEDLIEQNWIIAGSPETVRAKLEEAITETGVGRVILNFSLGVKPKWMVEKSLGLFAEQVLPHFRKDGRTLAEREPNTAGYRTNLEYEHKRRKDVPNPTIVQDGHLVDVTKAWVDGQDPRIRPWTGEVEPAAANA